MAIEDKLRQKRAEQEMRAPIPSFAELEAMAAVEKPEGIPSFAELEARASVTPEEKEDTGFVSELGDIVTGIGRGAREEIAPFTVSDETIEEMKKEPLDVGKLAGEIVGGITSGLVASGVSAKLGATGAVALGTMIGVPAASLGVITAVGAGLGLGAYAVYSSIGQEHVESQLAEQDFSTARVLARTALQINPIARLNGEAAEVLAKTVPKLVKAGQALEKTAPRVARAATQVAGESAVAASTFGVESATVTGAVSTIINGIVFRKPAGSAVRRAKSLDEFMKTEVGTNFSQRLQERVQKIEAKPASEALKDDGFVSYLLASSGKGTPMSAITEDLSELKPKGKKALNQRQRKARIAKLLAAGEKKGGITPQLIEKMHYGYLANKEAKKLAGEIKEELSTKFIEAGKLPSKQEAFGEFQSIMSWMSDGQLMARATDRMFGTNTTTLLNDLSETRGKFDVVAAEAYSYAIEATKVQKKAGLSNEDVGRLRVFLSEKDVGVLTPDLKKYVDIDSKSIADPSVRFVITKWDKAWETARRNIVDEEYAIGDIAHYMPMKSLKGDTLAIQVRRSYESLKGIASDLDIDNVFKLTRKNLDKTSLSKEQQNKIVQDISFLRNLIARSQNKRYSDVKEPDIGRLIKNLLESGGGEDSALGYEISAMYSRGKERIPDRFRELDVGAAFARYIESNVRGAVYSPIHRKLQDNLVVMRALGANKTADWFEMHLDDTINGLNSSKLKLANSMRDWASKHRYRMDKLLEGTRFEDTMIQEALNGVPDLLGKWQANLYPAYLAYNVRATLRNLTQVVQLTAPELGGGYGYGNMARAYLNLYKDFKDPKTGKFSLKALARQLEELDLGGERILAEAIKDGRNKIPGTGIARKINDAGMAIFSSADVINRMVTYRMGQQLAQDVVDGNPAALKALAKMGKATLANIQTPEIKRQIANKDASALGDALGKMLVAKTQFHYGAEQRAQFARVLGPMFSMFTKWPVSIGSNIVDVWQENPTMYEKMKRYSELYAAPLVLLSAMGHVIDENLGDSGVIQYLIGDPTDVAAISAVSDISSLFKSPAAEAGSAIMGAAMQVFADPSEDRIKAFASTSLRKFIKTSIPPVSSVMNEIERIEKDLLGEKETTLEQAINELFGR